MVILTAGMTSVTGQVATLHNDNIYDGNETFSLFINEASLPTRVETRSDCVLNITIVDIDGKCVNYYRDITFRPWPNIY